MALNAPAKRGDFPASILMPTLNKTVQLNVGFSKQQMEKIMYGVIPLDMDDRWFVYYVKDEETLYLHRSWTGFCIYMVKFKKVDNGFAAVNVVVNTDPEQYTCSEDAHEKNICLDLVNNLFHI